MDFSKKYLDKKGFWESRSTSGEGWKLPGMFGAGADVWDEWHWIGDTKWDQVIPTIYWESMRLQGLNSTARFPWNCKWIRNAGNIPPNSSKLPLFSVEKLPFPGAWMVHSLKIKGKGKSESTQFMEKVLQDGGDEARKLHCLPWFFRNLDFWSLAEDVGRRMGAGSNSWIYLEFSWSQGERTNSSKIFLTFHSAFPAWFLIPNPKKNPKKALKPLPHRIQSPRGKKKRD